MSGYDYLYPASYDAVISVGAIDEHKVIADFSQHNDQVELVAPGVSVLSTVPPGSALVASLTTVVENYQANALEGSGHDTVTAKLIDCGLGQSSCSAKGAVCLFERGEITFQEKALRCEDGGGVAAVIYNNELGLFIGTLGDASISIPVIAVSLETGSELIANQSESVTVSVLYGDYDFYNGTSMATPHVTGAAALLWSLHQECTNVDIRNALNTTAEDLGGTGRDDEYGYGLVQIYAAHNYISEKGCEVVTEKPGKPCRGKNCK